MKILGMKNYVPPTSGRLPDSDPATPFRSHPRPIRITMPDEQANKDLIKKAHTIRAAQNCLNFDPKKIFIVPDLTKLQLEEAKNLRVQLAEMQKQDPRFRIRRGKIVKITTPQPPQTL